MDELSPVALATVAAVGTVSAGRVFFSAHVRTAMQEPADAVAAELAELKAIAKDLEASVQYTCLLVEQSGQRLANLRAIQVRRFDPDRPRAGTPAAGDAVDTAAKSDHSPGE